MNLFIITLILAHIAQFYCARMYVNFSGASRSLYNYYLFTSGIGKVIVIALFIWACFLTTWWIPIVAYVIAMKLGIILPPSFKLEFSISLLYPLFVLASIVLLALNI